MKIISNCPLCEERGLHVMGEEKELMQCINCGYASASKYLGTKEDNEEYQKLTDEMKEWSVERNGRIWIPTMITLPSGFLYPFNEDPLNTKDKKMKWGVAEMVDIPKEEQKDYPIPGQEDKFYDKRYDTENANIYGTFLEALSFINEKSKEINSGIKSDIKLSTLHKRD